MMDLATHDVEVSAAVLQFRLLDTAPMVAALKRVGLATDLGADLVHLVKADPKRWEALAAAMPEVLEVAA